ncbi:MAG: glycosyltransferase family 4 protein [Chloroflexi bacterium]|nr:glycosyltransferase family 4 protein [Chloroflexota bacterium]
MRVIQVAPTPFGAAGLLGGGERYPLELARALAPLVESRLVTFGRQAGQWREPGGLTVQVVRPWRYAGGHPAHPLAPGLIGALAGADLVHTHHLRSAPSRIAAVVARVRGVPTAVTDHGLQGGDWRGLLPRLFDRFLLVSAASARELASPPRRTRLIYGGVDAERFRSDPGVRRAGVLFVGRLTPHKGVDRLIQALPDGARLTVAGSTGHDVRAPERDYPLLLRRLADGRSVRFIGPVPDDRLPALYREAAVFVLPSVERTCYGRSLRVSELLGLVLLEAMASGTPVICSRLGGLTEVVEDGVTGYLVEPGDVQALHGRLAELLGAPARAARMGKAGRERALTQFTWQACAERCLSAYSELLD